LRRDIFSAGTRLHDHAAVFDSHLPGELSSPGTINCGIKPCVAIADLAEAHCAKTVGRLRLRGPKRGAAFERGRPEAVCPSAFFR